MEEFVGNLWHQLISRRTAGGFPAAAVKLEEVSTTAGIIFHALEGNPGRTIEAAAGLPIPHYRTFRQRLAGQRSRFAMASVDDRALYLPQALAVFPERRLNREAYLWLTALAAQHRQPFDNWFVDNQALIADLLQRYPSLQQRYQMLVEALLKLRPAPQNLPERDGRMETAIRSALLKPTSVAELPLAGHAPFPVCLWLYPALEDPLRPAAAADAEAGASQPARLPGYQERKKVDYVDEPDNRDGLLVFRLENLFSWSEYLDVDRTGDDSEDENAAATAEDLDVITLARQRQSTAAALKLDLDLPAAQHDDLPLGEGTWLPEWDYRRGGLQPDRCCLQPMLDIDAPPMPVPERLSNTARRVVAMFTTLAPLRFWQRRQPEGDEIDLDAWLRFFTDRLAGGAHEPQVYRQFRGRLRDLDCLLLADLSMSTDAHLDNERRVIDVIQDSLLLFAEALHSIGDRFALYGFSSRSRRHVRFNLLKNFSEPYGDAVRGRIQSITPGFYTRMGAAIRQASRILAEQQGSQRLLLLLTDGKPNDLDHYEGRFGLEDTRQAIIEARREGLTPFCITIDAEAREYLPYLFGNQSFAVISKASHLPRELPRIYALLTGND